MFLDVVDDFREVTTQAGLEIGSIGEGSDVFLFQEVITEKGTGNQDLQHSIHIGTILQPFESTYYVLVSDNVGLS
jgi:hypothetical protein